MSRTLAELRIWKLKFSFYSNIWNIVWIHPLRVLQIARYSWDSHFTLKKYPTRNKIGSSFISHLSCSRYRLNEMCLLVLNCWCICRVYEVMEWACIWAKWNSTSTRYRNPSNVISFAHTHMVQPSNTFKIRRVFQLHMFVYYIRIRKKLLVYYC